MHSTQAADETKGRREREQSDYSPKYFEKLLLCLTNAIDQCSWFFLNEHRFQLKREVNNWIVCVEKASVQYLQISWEMPCP